MRIPKTRQILTGIKKSVPVFRFFDSLVISSLKGGVLPASILRSLHGYENEIEWYSPEGRALCEDDIRGELLLENQDVDLVPYLQREISDMRFPVDVNYLAAGDANLYSKSISRLEREGIISKYEAEGLNAVLRSRAIIVTRWMGIIQDCIAPAGSAPVTTTEGRLFFLKTQKSRDELKRMYDSLVASEYISDEKPDALESFMACFDTTSKKQGRIDWVKQATRNRALDCQSLCIFLQMHGVERGTRGENWIRYAYALAGVCVSESTTKRANTATYRETYSYVSMKAIVSVCSLD